MEYKSAEETEIQDHYLFKDEIPHDKVPIPKRGAFYALSFPNFKLFFIGQLISVAGTWMQTVAQQWFVYSLTHSAAWLGIVSGASAIPYVLFAAWGGQVADRFPRREVLVWTQALAMGFAFLQALIATGRWIEPQAWHVAVISGFLGIVNAFNMPAQQAFVTDIVEEREALSNAIALNSLRFNLARFIGPICAGFVLVRAGAASCFALNGLSYIAVIISLQMMKLAPFKRVHHQLSIWEGFSYIWNTKSVLRIVLLVGTASIFIWPISTLFPILADLYHSGPKGFSSLVALNGVGAAIGGLALAMGLDQLPKRALVYGGITVFALVLLELTFATVLGAALLWVLLSGFAMIVFGISSNTKVQEDVPDQLRGRVMAVYSLVFGGLFPLGGLEIGFLAEKIGALNAMRLNSVICLVITAGLYSWSRKDRLITVQKSSTR